MQEKKHYNKGQQIALTFPASKAKLKQDKLLKEVQEQLKIQKEQNAEQAKLILELKKFLADKKDNK